MSPVEGRLAIVTGAAQAEPFAGQSAKLVFGDVPEEPREVAQAVLFPAWGEWSFMTGQSIVVDGGRTAQ